MFEQKNEIIKETLQAKKIIGSQVILNEINSIPEKPGIYLMLNSNNKIQYVGKAKNLKKRIASYLNKDKLSIRIAGMIALTAKLEITITSTEVEALLLESNLIKKYKPKYNILLRDDKSFPYIAIRKNHLWPQLTKHRGIRNSSAEYFGPFVSVASVNRAITALHKAFPLRSCSDQEFLSRKRPCLQFQINRCTGPCDNRINNQDYDLIVKQVRDFLKGNNSSIQNQLSKLMENASKNLDYETAAKYRDRLEALTYIQSQQNINIDLASELDVISIFKKNNLTCVFITFYRMGQNLGSKSYFPSNTKDSNETEILSAFIKQFYSKNNPAKNIFTNFLLKDKDLIESFLSYRFSKSIKIKCPQKGKKYKLVLDCFNNAKSAHQRKIYETKSQSSLLLKLSTVLNINQKIKRIEVYDNSHLNGTNAVGAMIVAGEEGFLKKEYRKFNIKSKNISPGDDYSMMKEVFKRRFRNYTKLENNNDNIKNPDLIIIDGGIGHLRSVKSVFSDLLIKDISIISIAKGEDRKFSKEKIYAENESLINLDVKDQIYYFLQRLRDEAHRFAVSSHRILRSKSIKESPLDLIEGIGQNRKRSLLNHFGSTSNITKAGLDDLQRVKGISKNLAKIIYKHFQN
ncbi:excinuclease ABC subunit UvrC [Alphaproteobacteria bacterium]|nr:excinuclease ABC subunit UvrC [Alphaproteobacteria bacterium]